MGAALMNCGVCCFVISIWATLQLIVMAICFHCELVVLIEDVEEHEYDDFDDFMKKTKKNYAAVARNCLIAAIIYFLLIGVSYGCIRKAKKQLAVAERQLKDDEFFCKPKPPPKINEKKIK